MATTIYTPKNGISTDTNQNFLYLTNPDGRISRLSISTLGSGTTEQQRLDSGRAILASQYGINLGSVPKINSADLDQQLLRQFGGGSNGVAQYGVGNINDYVGQAPAQLQGTQLNTDPSLQGFTNPNAVNPATGGYQAQPTAQAPRTLGNDTTTGLPLSNPNANYFQPGQGGNPTTSGGTLGGGSSVGGGTIGAGGVDLSTLSPEFKGLYDELEGYLKRLQENGQVLNPNIDITPDQVAAFTKQAETEINPYYSGQLKLAREDLLRSVGKATEDIGLSEADAQRKYGTGLRQLGETSADQGFAQSGLRNRAEGDLATDTQNSINANRRTLDFNTGSAVRSFAQKYGTSEVPQLNIGGSPAVSAGEPKFGTGSSSSLYQLSPDVYNGLVGSEEYARRGAVSSRASQLEGAFRSNQAVAQQRTLTL